MGTAIDYEVIRPDFQFGIGTFPATLLYGFLNNPVITDFGDAITNTSFVDVAGTSENLNTLKSSFGFNALSVGLDDLLLPWGPQYQEATKSWSFSETLLFRALRDSNWEWSEVLLSLGSGCDNWVPSALEVFFNLQPLARSSLYGLYIDEPLRSGAETNKRELNGLGYSNRDRCLSWHYPEVPNTSNRIEGLSELAKRYGTRLFAGGYISALDTGLFGYLGHNPFPKMRNYVEGLFYTGYDHPAPKFANPKRALPIPEWDYLVKEYGQDKIIGTWISNSCSPGYYSYGTGTWGTFERLGLRKPVCEKDYFNTLLHYAAENLDAVFLYAGDMPEEMRLKILFSRAIYNYSGKFLTTEPALKKEAFLKISQCIDEDESRLNDINRMLWECPEFRNFVKAVYWTRMAQYRKAAIEERILWINLSEYNTGYTRYCVDGPILKSDGQVDVIDCSRCAKWVRAKAKPISVKYCPDGIYSDPTGGGKVTPPNPFNPLRKSITPPSAKTSSGKSIISQSNVTPTSSLHIPHQILSKTVPITGVSSLGGAYSGAVKPVDGPDYENFEGDNYVPLSQRQYIVRYLIR